MYLATQALHNKAALEAGRVKISVDLESEGEGEAEAVHHLFWVRSPSRG